MNFISRLFGRRVTSPRRSRRTSAINIRRARSERLEDRSLLSATLTLGELQMPIGSANINLSEEALGAQLSSETMQSEMTLDINPTNPLNVAGFSHRIRVVSGSVENSQCHKNHDVVCEDEQPEIAALGVVGASLHMG